MAAGLSDGSASTFTLGHDDTLQANDKWEETRLRTGERYIRMTVSERFVPEILSLNSCVNHTFLEEYFHVRRTERCD